MGQKKKKRELPAEEGLKSSRAFLYYLTFTALVSGALVMVLEVLGSRVIGPFFGVGLFVWTSLIAVALVGLSLGYYAGGLLADRKQTPDCLYGCILLAGLSAVLVPFIKRPVLLSLSSLDLRLGALMSAGVLFGPPLFLLGCVSPYIIKMAARELKNIGRTVGIFYAVSTAGSFIGTVLTGFVLIAYFRVNSIFVFIGSVLIALSAVYFIAFRKKWYPLMFLIPGVLYLAGPEPARSVTRSSGARTAVVFSGNSFYGNIKVVDHFSEQFDARLLLIDGGVFHSAVDLRSGESLLEYSYFMEFLPSVLRPGGRDCLVVGLGAGAIPMWFEKMGVKTDVVEIDPRVEEVARKYFGLDLSGEVAIEDARYFFSRPGKKYDYIILDAFSGDMMPGHLLSIEAFRAAKGRLKEGGILAINLICSLEKETYTPASVRKTLSELFETVEVYPCFTPKEEDDIGNVAIMAYDFPAAPLDRKKLASFDIHPELKDVVGGLMGEKFSFPPGTPAMVLSDEYNPFDFHSLWLKEQLRKNFLAKSDKEFLELVLL